MSDAGEQLQNGESQRSQSHRSQAQHSQSQHSDRPRLNRTTVVAAAHEMIRVGGLEALSLRRLAAVLGVTAAALYAYVEDKDDLLRAVAEGEFTELVAAYEAVTDASPRQRMIAQALAYVDRACEEPELFRVMFLFPPGPLEPAENGPAELPAATTAFNISAAAISDAIDAGVIVADDPLAVTLVFWAAVHGVASVLQLGLDSGSEARRALVEEMMKRLLAGYA